MPSGPHQANQGQYPGHDQRRPIFHGGHLIGADDIYSSVRQEMRRIADATDPRYFEPGKEDKLPCYYQCSF